jgi:hypothetical protein
LPDETDAVERPAAGVRRDGRRQRVPGKRDRAQEQAQHHGG